MSILKLIIVEFQLSCASVGFWRTLFWGVLVLVKHGGKLVASNKKLMHNIGKTYGVNHGRTKPLVVFVASDNSAGSGAFQSMSALARIVRDRHGFEVFVVTPFDNAENKLLEGFNLPHCAIGSFNWVVPLGFDVRASSRVIVGSIVRNHFAIISLARMIKSLGAGLVHCNTTYTYVGALAARVASVPCVWHLREFLEEDQGRTLWNRDAGNKLISRADRIIAISTCIYTKYQGVFEKERFVRIMNGVDVKRFYRPDHRVMTERNVIFVMLGNFQRHKGHLEFANACVRLKFHGHENFIVWFIGGGDVQVQSEVQKIFENGGLANKVKFWGFQARPEDLLEQADVAFMCSRSEAFGRVTVEAMLSGCLMVGADTAATAELINDGETGILFNFKAGCCDDLVCKMKEVLSSPKQMQRIAIKGQEHMVRNMTADRNADEVVEVYKQLLNYA